MTLVRQVSRFRLVPALVIAVSGYAVSSSTASLNTQPTATPSRIFQTSAKPLPTSNTPEQRSRAVNANIGALLATHAPGGTITLNLFDDYAPIARVDSVRLDNDYWVLSGEIVGDSESSFLFVAGPTTLTGEVRSPSHGSYEVRHTAWGVHVVRQIDDMGFKPCGTKHHHEAHGHGDHEGSATPRGGTPDIRVAVFFTPLARSDEGGEEAIRGRAVFAVNQANQAYTFSQANSHLTLAHTGVVEYTESGEAGTDLSRLRNTSDGQMDIVHCIRQTVQADMVALLVNNFDACGIGYLQLNPGPGFASSAFTVTDKDCISNFTFAHELGHNMGCAHDRDNAGNAAFDYAYGYRTPDSAFRTIMSYAPGTRIQRFSNPNITYQGYVLGLPLNDPNPTYNALCITNTSPVISLFRNGTPGRYADFNRDGVVTSQDFFEFLPAFFASSSTSDFNADGIRNSQDFFDFIAAFFASAC